MAGLWADNIPLDLLWRKTGNFEDAESSDAQAPSFSWASVDGEVDYYCFRNGKLPYRAAAQVMAFKTSTSPQMPLGRVSSGQLTLKGPLIPTTLKKYSESGAGWGIVRVGDRHLEVATDSRIGYIYESGADASHRYACRNGRHAEESVHALAQPDEYPGTVHTLSPGGPRCWVLKLGEFGIDGREDGRWDAELMVLGASPTHPGCYQRLGLVSDIVRGLNDVFDETTVKTITLV